MNCIMMHGPLLMVETIFYKKRKLFLDKIIREKYKKSLKKEKNLLKKMKLFFKYKIEVFENFYDYDSYWNLYF